MIEAILRQLIALVFRKKCKLPCQINTTLSKILMENVAAETCGNNSDTINIYVHKYLK